MHARFSPLLALLAPCALLAQDFRLEDYEPAAYHRRFLSIAPQLNWNANSDSHGPDGNGPSQSSFYSTPQLQSAYGSRAWDSARSWQTGVEFSALANRARYESDPALEAGQSGRGYEQENDQGRLQGHAYSDYRIRLGGPWFFESAGNADFEVFPPFHNRNESWTRETTAFGADSTLFDYLRSRDRRSIQNWNGHLRFAFGLGRIVDVGFASRGLFLLDQGAKQGYAAPRLDARGMHDLEAYVEARRKQRPFLDTRRAAVYDMGSVERYLAERGGSPVPADALLAMADEWANPSPIPRERGWEIKAYPFFNLHWETSRWRSSATSFSGSRPIAESVEASKRAVLEAGTSSESVTHQRGFRGTAEAGVGLGAEYRRPWRRFFQFDAGTGAEAWRTRTEAGEHEWRTEPGSVQYLYPNYYVQYENSGAALDGMASFAWIPDPRAFLRATARADARVKWDYGSVEGGAPAHASAVRSAFGGLSLDGGYSIAPRISLTGAANVSTDWSESGSDPIYTGDFVDLQRSPESEAHRSWFGISFGLTYYLF